MERVPLEFFIEGTRSRTGKCLKPKFGLLGMITESFFTNQVDDICFVPIHINYERLVEAEVYPNELLGVPKRRESLSGLIEARSILSEDYGRISIKIDQPISLKDYAHGFSELYSHCPNMDPEKFDPFVNQNDRRLVNLKLGHRIIHNINQQAVWSAVSLVSSILLAYRFGVPRAKLVELVEWLRGEIVESGAGNPDWLLDQPPSALVEKGLSGLAHAVLTRRDGMVMPDVDSESCLVLSIYKNKIVHAFMRPSAISIALFSCIQNKKENSDRGLGDSEDQFPAFSSLVFVDAAEVVEEARFIHELLDLEVIYKEDPEKPENFGDNLRVLVDSGILVASATGAVAVEPAQMDKFLFYCNVLWPFIESYWVTGTVLILGEGEEASRGEGSGRSSKSPKATRRLKIKAGRREEQTSVAQLP
jgi:glycerone phosphate O-acyltransferase/fatty acyl-CoA reductase